MPNIKRFSLQIVHAGLAALVYFGIEVISEGLQPVTYAAQTTPLKAGVPVSLDIALANSQLIVLVAFVLSLTTSGLLYSILSRPGAK